MYSDSIKYRAIIHYKYFLKNIRTVASIYNIGKSTLCRWLQKEGIKTNRKVRTNKIAEIQHFVSTKLNSNPFLSTYDLSKMVKRELNVSVSNTTCWRALMKSNFSRKRTRAQVRKADTNIKTDAFKSEYKQSSNFVSVDETFFYLYDYPRYGYSKKGQQIKRYMDHTPRKKKITLYMAVSNNRIVGYKLVTKHGNTTDFKDFIDSLNIKDCTLLLDNVAFHKTKILKDLAHSNNIKLLYTPPYSPDYNPIEIVFSKIKDHYRKLNYIRDADMIDNIHSSIDIITQSDLLNIFDHVTRLVYKN